MRASEAIWWLCPPRKGIGMPKSSDWWRKNAARQALWAGLCLALIALLVYRVAAASSGSSLTFRPDDLRDGVAFFDSFSDPSVACAILRQEAERLLLIYCEHWARNRLPRRGRLALAGNSRPNQGRARWQILCPHPEIDLGCRRR